MKIYLGADHGGFDAKQRVVGRLREDGFAIEDLGALEMDENDDFVDIAVVLAERVSMERDSVGVLFCRNGVGVSIVANRFEGIRCALGFDREQVARARKDDDVNCLAIPADYLDEDKVYELIKAFLETKFSAEDKYERRLEKLSLLGGGCCGGGCCGGC